MIIYSSTAYLGMPNIALSFITGLITLGLQFVFNRLIFFYVVNTDYATVSVISLHLIGFLVGALLAGKAPLRWRRYRETPARPERKSHAPAMPVVALALLPPLVMLSYTVTWRYGLDLLPILGVLSVLGLSAFTIALLGGYIIARLMAGQETGARSTFILIADTAGSVFGAVLAGFWLLPYYGLNVSFLVFAGLAALLALFALPRGRFLVPGACAFCGALFLLPSLDRANARLRAEGFPLMYHNTSYAELVASQHSPMGVLSVVRDRKGQSQMLHIDNMPLCSLAMDGSDLKSWSEYEIGRFPAEFVAHNGAAAPRVVVVGLGCGLTLAGALRELPPDAAVTMVEVNPDMPKMRAHFAPVTGDPLADPRVTLVIQDGFKFFMQGEGREGTHDAVIVDITWMRDATLTHLFAYEFFTKIRQTLKPGGVFALWNEGGSLEDPVAHTVYATLQAVFPHVGVRAVSGSYIYFAGNDDTILKAMPAKDQDLTKRLRMASAGAPLNTLDNLVLNYLIFGRGQGMYSWKSYVN
ncbi:MAG: hypothetical protein NW215_00445 [Hyphomicrobiales bacterium]|nr:hypothetical protein [Hyphomicrobiales bacterium]